MQLYGLRYFEQMVAQKEIRVKEDAVEKKEIAEGVSCLS